MKYQSIFFWGKKNKNVIKLSSAESAQKVITVKYVIFRRKERHILISNDLISCLRNKTPTLLVRIFGPSPNACLFPKLFRL